MDSSDYSVLVGRLERSSDHHPRLYQARAALVAAAGYVLIAIPVAVVLLACSFLARSLIASDEIAPSSVMLLLLGIGVTIAMVRALHLDIEPPEGRALTREEVPALFAMLDDVLQRMAWKRGNKVHTAQLSSVTVDNEFDVTLRQIPRWGVFGGYTNHLQLGIPLLAVLDLAELKTLIAHEIGHLNEQHGRLRAWMYRHRRTWQVLLPKFDVPKSVLDQIVGGFYRWYGPYFLAHSFVFARAQEYRADQVAALATNARVLARALVKADLVRRFLTEIYWPKFFAQVEQVPEPKYLPFAMLPRAVSIAHRDWVRTDWMEASLRRFGSDNDTHPGLGERLAALEVPAELPTPTQAKPALAVCAELAPILLKWCDDEWHDENAVAWRKRHDSIKEARWKIAQYQNMPPAEIKPDDVWQKSLLLLDLGLEDDAVEELRALVTLDPSIARAHFLLGRLLLEHGDERGLQNLTQAARDAELMESAGQIGYDYLMTRGRKREAQRFWERVQAA